MKKLVILMALVFCLISFAQMIFASDAPDKVTIEHVKDKKPVVVFEHKKHVERKIKCVDCHHKNDKAEPKKGEGCAKCHGKADDGDKIKAEKAYHKNCKDECHKKEKKGPTKCEDCHKK